MKQKLNKTSSIGSLTAFYYKLRILLSLYLVLTCLFILFFNIDNKVYASSSNITVFIDPGHGGKDPGCVHNGLNEKDVNLKVSLKLKSRLEQNGYRVVMSRTTDIYRSLDERVNMANSSGADLFLSIHGNAALNPDANGTETFWSPSGATGSSQFATAIQKNLVKSINRRDRGVKTADFIVIKYTKMSSALVEYVFLSNPEEAQLLKNDSFLNKIADGLFNGIKEHSLSIISNKKILMDINYPKDNNTISATITLRGWAVENSATVDTGITKIDVYDGPYTNKNFLGAATYGLSRPDVATYFGKENYTNSGYSLGIDTTKLTNGQHILYVYAYNPDLGWKYMTRKVNVSNGVPAEKKILMNIDYPKDGNTISATITLRGWAVENSATVDTGITKIDVYDGPYTNKNFLGAATYGLSRPDVATYFGKENYTNSGYSLGIDTTKLTNGQHILYVYAYNPDLGWKYMTRKVNVSNGVPAEKKILMNIDYPKDGNTISATITLRGWAVENSATVDTGITKIDVYDGPYTNKNFLGAATYGLSRPDVATYFGKENYTNSGYSLGIDTTKLTNGQHILYVYAYNPDLGWKYMTRKVNVSNGVPAEKKILMNIDYPKDGNTISATITLRGWAVENSATVDTGITKIDVYDGPYTNKNFLGAATYGLSRPDVATYFGKENYTNSGYSLGIDTTKLTNGQHILYVYAYNPDLGWKYMTRKVNVSNGVIDNSTNVIGKASATEEQLLSLFVSRNSNQIDRAGRLAPLYIKWGNTFNIRYDIAWAMMCHETGFLQFGGIVPPDANNFCGLGATGATDENGNYIYNSFATEELGVIAQYIHLAWYIYPDHLTLKDSNGDLYCSTKYDPRHFGTGHNYNGDSTLGTLNERWAPAPDYTNKIIQFANEIYN